MIIVNITQTRYLQVCSAGVWYNKYNILSVCALCLRYAPCTIVDERLVLIKVGVVKAKVTEKVANEVRKLALGGAL